MLHLKGELPSLSCHRIEQIDAPAQPQPFFGTDGVPFQLFQLGNAPLERSDVLQIFLCEIRKCAHSNPPPSFYQSDYEQVFYIYHNITQYV